MHFQIKAKHIFVLLFFVVFISTEEILPKQSTLTDQSTSNQIYSSRKKIYNHRQHLSSKTTYNDFTYTPPEFENSTLEKIRTPLIKLITKNKMISLLNVPDVFQATEYTCGPASLLAVLTYFQIYTHREVDIAKLAKTSSDTGTSPGNLVKAAKSIAGHLAIQLRQNMDLRSLEGYLSKNSPVIVLFQAWKDETDPPYIVDYEDGHFVVVIGYDNENLYIEDPWVLGSLTVLKKSQFILRWHDYVSEEKRIMNQVGIIITSQRKQVENVIYLQ